MNAGESMSGDGPAAGRILLTGDFFMRVRARLEAKHPVDVWDEIADHDAWLSSSGSRIAGLATDSLYGAAGDVIRRLPNLRIISCFGVGYDAIDMAAAREGGIVVTHTPDVLNDEVAHTAIMLILATGRRLTAADAYARADRWRLEGGFPLTSSLLGKRVGLVGFGRIGRRIAAMLKPMGCSVAYHARRRVADAEEPWFDNLIALATDSDYLVAIVPGGAATERMIDGAVLEALGPEGIFINVARGSVADEAALIEALRRGDIAAAGLDVFADEPNIPVELRNSDRVTLTPHIGSATRETRGVMGRLAADNLLRFLASGEVITPVPECRDMAPTVAA